MFPNFTLFGKTIFMYPLLAAAGALAAGFVCCKIAKRRFGENDSMLMLLLMGAVGALLGGHVLYALTNLKYLAALLGNLQLINSFGAFISYIKLIFGGSVFYGGLLGGIAAGGIYIKVKKLEFRAYADIAAVGIPLFHAFGRVGCFLGGCCFGKECGVGFFYSSALIPELIGTRRFPIQLVEAAFNLILFSALLFLLLKGRFSGELLPVYLLLYSAGRFVLEFFRGDAYRGFLFGLSTSQLISAILFALSAAWLIAYGVRSRILKRRGQAQAK